jgi:hypothetical protein
MYADIPLQSFVVQSDEIKTEPCLGWDVFQVESKQMREIYFLKWDLKFSRRRLWCSELSSGTRQYIPEDNSGHYFLKFGNTVKTGNSLNIFLS